MLSLFSLLSLVPHRPMLHAPVLSKIALVRYPVIFGGWHAMADGDIGHGAGKFYAKRYCMLGSGRV
jgi:hypothetical protein